MSIYRTMLENDLELGGVISTENDNAPELQEIEDVVADHDANSEEQLAAQAAEFGEGDVSDILDETAIIIAEAEMNNNAIMMAIGIHEVNVMAESGKSEVIYESLDDIKGYIKKAKDWVVKFFKKVWQVLSRYAKNIASAFHTNKGFADKYESQIRDGFNAFKNDGKAPLKGYTFEGLETLIKKDDWTSSTGNLLEMSKKTSAGSFDLYGGTNSDLPAMYADRYRKSICGVDCSASEFREKLKNYVYGNSAGQEAKKKEMKMSADKVLSALRSKDDTKNCKKSIDKAKTEFKTAIKLLDALQSKASRGTKDENKDNAAAASKQLSGIIRYNDAIHQCLTAAQVSRAVILSAARARMAQARIYGQAYVAAANKANPKYKGFQKESAGMGYLANVELI